MMNLSKSGNSNNNESESFFSKSQPVDGEKSAKRKCGTPPKIKNPEEEIVRRGNVTRTMSEGTDKDDTEVDDTKVDDDGNHVASVEEVSTSRFPGAAVRRPSPGSQGSEDLARSAAVAAAPATAPAPASASARRCVTRTMSEGTDEDTTNMVGIINQLPH